MKHIMVSFFKTEGLQREYLLFRQRREAGGHWQFFSRSIGDDQSFQSAVEKAISEMTDTPKRTYGPLYAFSYMDSRGREHFVEEYLCEFLSSVSKMTCPSEYEASCWAVKSEVFHLLVQGEYLTAFDRLLTHIDSLPK